MIDVIDFGSFLGRMAGMKLKNFWPWSRGGAGLLSPYHYSLTPIEASELLKRILLQSHQYIVTLMWKYTMMCDLSKSR